MKKITRPQEGTLFLFIVSSIIWFFICFNNNNNLLGSILVGIIAGGFTTLVLAILYSFMKSTFNW